MATKKETLDRAMKNEGCLGHAADNEEVFVLRAKDGLAPQTIRYWARGLQAAVGQRMQVPDEEHEDYEQAISVNRRIDAQEAKAQDALDIADRMEEFQGRKIPD